MKLYTEEQVIKAYNMGVDDGHNGAISLQINELSLTPIELPSDEEIENYADYAFPYAEKLGGQTYAAHKALKIGAKWVIEQIKQQDKNGE